MHYRCVLCVQKKCTGGQLFNQVCNYLNLVEQDFFGLTFVHQLLNVWFWLDFDKPILKQLARTPHASPLLISFDARTLCALLLHVERSALRFAVPLS